MKILITGCCGFIGCHLTKALIDEGHDIYGLDNMNKEYWNTNKTQNLNFNNKKMTFIKEDVVDTQIIKKIKPDIVFHLANLAGVRKSIERPIDYIRVNVEGTTNLLDQIEKYSKNTLFIYASSSSVYGNHQGEFKEDDKIKVKKLKSQYALSKKMMEDLALFYHINFNISCIGVRFFTVYGPRGRFDMAPYKFLDALNNNKTITKFGKGETYRDYTYVTDIIDGLLKIKDHHMNNNKRINEIYNLGNNNPITLNTFIKTCEKVCNSTTKIETLDIPSSDVFGTCANIDKVKTIGYNPNMTLEKGLNEMNKFYKNNYIKYSVLYIANHEFFLLLKMSVNSFYLNSDQSKVNNIYIVDIGLTEEERKYLGQYEKVKFINSKKIKHKVNKLDLHSEAWVEAVCQKTIQLNELIKNSKNETILLFDADTITINDFSHFFDTKYTIQLCLREIPNPKNEYIACFVVFNLQNNKEIAVEFVNRWITVIKNMMEKKLDPPYETKAMNTVVQEFKTKGKNIFGDLPEVKIASCGKNWYNDSCIIHLKSKVKKDSIRKNIAKRRIKLVENYSKSELRKYLIDLTFKE